MKQLYFSLFIGIILLTGCGEQISNDVINESEQSLSKQKAISHVLNSDRYTHFKIHVFYEDGASPYTDKIGLSGNNTWDITLKSFEALLASKSFNIIVPNSINQMKIISKQNNSKWSANQLRELGENIVPPLEGKDDINFAIIFVKGEYIDSENILGVHLSGTHYAFVFKDVVIRAGGGSISQKYIEQTTVVHELGHAIGLVNNGIPLHKQHEDNDHPHHTNNSECAMYWAVESALKISDIVRNSMGNNELNLFKAEVIKDLENFK